jgi:uncharacterized protein (DUF362 family)
MKNDKHDAKNMMERRQFILKSLEAAAAIGMLPLVGKLALGAEAKAGGGSSTGSASKVCLVRVERKMSPQSDNSEIIGRMIDEGIKYVTSGEAPEKYWSKNFRKGEKVAIKVSAVINRQINFGPQIAGEIIRNLKSAGIKEEDIFIYERDSRSLKIAGYKVNTGGKGVQIYGNDEGGYCGHEDSHGKFKDSFCNVIDKADALINMPILKAHTLTGVSIALKNHYGSFKSPEKCHANGCDPYIADVNATKTINSKHRIVICDAMRVLYAGGPEFDPNYTEDYNGIIVATDPVAVDALGADIVKRLRKASGKKPLPYYAQPKYIETAAKMGLGNSSPNMIDFKTIVI